MSKERVAVRLEVLCILALVQVQGVTLTLQKVHFGFIIMLISKISFRMKKRLD